MIQIFPKTTFLNVEISTSCKKSRETFAAGEENSRETSICAFVHSKIVVKIIFFTANLDPTFHNIADIFLCYYFN